MAPTPTTTSNAKGWFILHFEDPSIPMSHDILYMNNPAEPLDDASDSLERTIFERFDRMGDMDSGDSFRLGRLAVVCPNNADLQITLLQLVTFLRDLPASPGATKPDLWGFGGNSMHVAFEYVPEDY